MTAPDYVPDADALSLAIGTAIPTTIDPALRHAWRDERVRIYFDRYPDTPLDGATVYLGHDTHDVLHACGPSCARAIVEELDGEFVDAGLNAWLDVAGPADAAATVDLGDADLGNDDEAPCARSGCNGVVIRAELLLPCGCRPHATRMTPWGFRCDTEGQGYCNFECPHADD